MCAGCNRQSRGSHRHHAIAFFPHETIQEPQFYGQQFERHTDVFRRQLWSAPPLARPRNLPPRALRPRWTRNYLPLCTLLQQRHESEDVQFLLELGVVTVLGLFCLSKPYIVPPVSETRPGLRFLCFTTARLPGSFADAANGRHEDRCHDEYRRRPSG